MAIMLNWFYRLFASPIFEDEEKTRIAQFMIAFSWFAICVVFLLIVTRFVIGTDASLIPVIIFVLIILLLLLIQYFVKLGHVMTASMVVVTVLWGLLTYLAWYVDGLRDLAIIAYIIVIMLSSLRVGRHRRQAGPAAGLGVAGLDFRHHAGALRRIILRLGLPGQKKQQRQTS